VNLVGLCVAGIGVLGGTFDPIHLGHLRSAWDVADALSLDALQFVPSYQPVHRDTPQASVEQRLDMVRLSIADMPNWSVNTSEIRRGGPSYTIDTLSHLRQQVGSDVPIWLLLGSDAFEGFVRWHRWQEILTLANLAVMVRAGAESIDCSSTNALMAQHETVALSSLQVAGMVRRIAVTPLAISATAIRAEVARGKLPHYLVTPAVLDYIQQQNLYQGI
jgi:nicotinate-nucleotide adenylyltransferase